MFKKLVKIGGQNQLSGKDRKTLKAELVKQLGDEEVEHFFAAHQKIICEKVSGSKTLIYVTDDYPAFVDGTGKSEFFPTLYAMSAYPTILPSLSICEGVQTFLLGGANLMWPGVADYSGLGDFKKDDLVAVKSCKGEFVAIAALAVSSKELTDETRKGTACYILHYLNDKLWEHGPKIAPKVEFQRQIKVAPKKTEEIKEGKKETKAQEPKVDVKPVVKEEKEVEKPKQPEKDKKDKKKKGDKQEEPAEQPKPEQPAETTKQPPFEVPKKVEPAKEESSQSQEEELATLLHNKKGVQPKQQPTKKVTEDKVENKFSDDSDDDKKKKKKKPQKKKDQEPVQVEKKPAKGKGARKEESEDEDAEVKKPNKKKGKKQESESEEEQVQEKKPAKKGKKKGDDEEEIQQTKEVEQKSSLAPHLMDEQFKEALLNALKLAVDDNDLPIDSGMFYTEYILPARREGVTLDIKQSSFKKMNKFYETMDKQGFIQFKQGKQKNGAIGSMIVKVHRDNEILSEHVPTIKKLAAKGEEASEEEKEEKADPKLKFKMSSSVQVKEVYRLATCGHKKQGKAHHDKEEEKEKQEPTTEENPLEFLFPIKHKEAEKKEKGKDRKATYDPEEYITEDFAKDKIDKYISKFQEQSVKKGDAKTEAKEEEEEDIAKIKKEKKEKERYEEEDKKKDKKDKYIYIDYSHDPNIQKLLKDEIEVHEHFLKLEAEKPVDEDGEEKVVEKEKTKKKKDRDEHNKQLLKITREQIEHKAMQFLQPFHQIIDKENNVMEFRAGKFNGIHVAAEKSNNKNITTLSGFELFLVPKDKVNQQTTNFISLLQQKFNTSVSAHNLQKKAGGKELSIQGHFLDEVVSMLVDDFKIRKEYITTTNKLDKKKKN